MFYNFETKFSIYATEACPFKGQTIKVVRKVEKRNT